MTREQVTGRPDVERPLEAKIKFATEINKVKANALKDKVAQYLTDFEKPVRLGEYECKSCYYLQDSLAELNFINVTCGNCKTQFAWGDSNPPILCRKCAEQHQICIRCYGEIQ